MTIRVIVTIPAVNGLPKDAVTNTWYIEPVATRDPGEFVADLHDFYQAWMTLRSGLLQWNAAHVKMYDMDDAVGPGVHREAFAVGLLALTADASTTTLPSEVSLCMSFQNYALTTVPQARRRGRVYLGPFGTTSANGTTGRPSTTALATITTAAGALVAASSASSTYKWCVYSATIGTVPGTHTDHGSGYTVEGGWIDDAWDTQRRRGISASGKSFF